MFNSIFGSVPGLSGNAQNAYQQNQPGSSQHSQNMAAQQQAAQYNQILMQRAAAGLAGQQHQWMINGRTMTWDQWLDELAPGEDNSLRTFLILKYKE